MTLWPLFKAAIAKEWPRPDEQPVISHTFCAIAIGMTGKASNSLDGNVQVVRRYLYFATCSVNFQQPAKGYKP